MNERSSAAIESLASPLYVLALLLVITPLVDIVANVWPLRFGEVSWRYGTAGASSGYLLTPLLGLALAGLVAVTLRHRAALRLLVWVCLVMAVVLVIVAIDFALDVMQLRHTVPVTPPLARWSFDVGAAKAIFKHLTAAVALAWLGLASRRALRAFGSSGEHASTPPLVRHSGVREQ